MKEVFIVNKNSDFTEGRGPMIFHSVYDTFEAADKYIMGNGGIYGSKQGLESQRDNSWSYNGYDIHRVPLKTIDDVLNKAQIEALRIRKETLKKELKNIESLLYN